MLGLKGSGRGGENFTDAEIARPSTITNKSMSDAWSARIFHWKGQRYDSVEMPRLRRIFRVERALRQGLCSDCWFGRASERRQRREKIAVVVMQGLLSNSAIKATDDDLIKEAAANAAKACVAITDALIAELGKEQKL